MKKHTIILTAALLAAASLLSSCGKQESAGNTIKGSEADLAFKVSDKKLDLTFFYCSNGFVYNDKMPVFTEAERLTNIHLKGSVPDTTTDYNHAFNTMMASGNLDDVITADKNDFEKYAAMGAFKPLDELIDQNAPHIKAYLDENPELKRNITSSDRHIYYLPRIETGETAKGWYIRKDWLEKLGLEEPKTVDEFYKVLQAFKTQDPNGNGQQDEIPYFDRAQNIGGLYALFGVRDRFYVDDKTNEVKFGAYTPEYKTAVSNVAKWYKEGLIDPEVFTRGSNARDQLLGDNVGGCTHDWFTSTSAYNEKLASKIPGINFAAVAPPADINGDVWEDTGRKVSTIGWGISASNSHPEETIKYFDFWFTPSGNKLFNYGVEGDQYTMVDGHPQFTEAFIKTDKPMTSLWWENGINLYIGGVQDFNAELQFMSDQAKKDIDLYVNNKYIKPQMPTLPFTREEQKVISDKLSSIESYMAEQEQKWIMNTQSVDDTFDGYIENCKNLGMDEILKIYNDAYKRYLAN